MLIKTIEMRVRGLLALFQVGPPLGRGQRGGLLHRPLLQPQRGGAAAGARDRGALRGLCGGAVHVLGRDGRGGRGVHAHREVLQRVRTVHRLQVATSK